MKLLEKIWDNLLEPNSRNNLTVCTAITAVLSVLYVMFLAEKLVTFSDVFAVLTLNLALFASIVFTVDALNEVASKEKQAEKEKRSDEAAPQSPFNVPDYKIWVRPPDDIEDSDQASTPEYTRRYGMFNPNGSDYYRKK